MSDVFPHQLQGWNLAATVDPVATNDFADGRVIGSIWVNISASPRKIFFCASNTVANAVWIDLSKSTSDTLTVTQSSHGFAVNKYLIYDKTTSSWKLANTTGNYAIGSIGRVTSVIDINTFVLEIAGKLIDYIGLTAGEFYYGKDDGSGDITLTPPTNVIQALLFALPSNKAVELSYPAVTPSSPITPSSTPLGYNDLRTSFTGANWNYEGLTNNGGGISLSGSIAVSGTAGWRYLVVDTLGALAVETIPPAEITVNTQQYTPAPVLNIANNGYYSSVNTTKRIIAIGYFDGVNLLETISYGTGKKRNDDYWRNDVNGTDISNTAGQRLQFTAAMRYARGSNIAIVDNGAGSDDTFGARVTNLSNSPITIFGDINTYSISTSATSVVSVRKNGAPFIDNIVSLVLIGSNASASTPFSFTDINSQNGDYYTFVIIDATNAGVVLTNLGANK